MTESREFNAFRNSRLELNSPGFGPFKKQIWDLPLSVRKGISRRLEEKFNFLFHELRATDTYDMVAARVAPVYVARAMPEGLKKLMEEPDAGTRYS